MLQEFLTDVLNVEDDLASDNACRIEHAVDEIVSRRLSCFVEFLSQNAHASQLIEKFNNFCDREDTIEGGHCPGANEQQVMTLPEIKPGRKVKILRLGGSSQTNQRLAKAGIACGSLVSGSH